MLVTQTREKLIVSTNVGLQAPAPPRKKYGVMCLSPWRYEEWCRVVTALDIVSTSDMKVLKEIDCVLN